MGQWQKTMLESVNLEGKNLYHDSQFVKYGVGEPYERFILNVLVFS